MLSELPKPPKVSSIMAQCYDSTYVGGSRGLQVQALTGLMRLAVQSLRPS